MQRLPMVSKRGFHCSRSLADGPASKAVFIFFQELGDLQWNQSERGLHVVKVPGRPTESHVSTRLTLSSAVS